MPETNRTNHSRNYRRIALLFGVPLLVLAALMMAGAAAARLPAGDTAATGKDSPSTCGVWSVVTSANSGTSSNFLYGISALPAEAWAVGKYSNSGTDQTLTERWNGSIWSVVPSANVASVPNTLKAVAALAANNVWAVGNSGNSQVLDPRESHGASQPANPSGGTAQTLVEQWNGSSWSIVSSPNVPASGSNYLLAISALSSNDIWAAGYYVDNAVNAFRTLVLHYNGSTWSIANTPNSGTDANELYGITALAPNNVWAVGFYGSSSASRTLTLHFDGSSWSIVTSPNASAGANTLYGVSGRAANDVWAVGRYFDTAANIYKSLALHYDGANWITIASPSPGTSDNTLNGVYEVASNDVWAVGSMASGGSDQTLIEHWDGSSWAVAQGGNTGSGRNILIGVSGSDPNNVWAAGHFDAGGVEQTLVERYGGLCGSPTPARSSTPVSSATSASSSTPTNTVNVGATQTAGAIATQTAGVAATQTWVAGATRTAYAASVTPCAIQYSDVPPPPTPGSTFYDYVRCLSCRQILSGYGDGTFRPGALVTRGQIAKIVSNAAGYNDPIPATQQSFEDVQSTNAFWAYIERLTGRGFMSGYPCGGAFEPCVPPGNRPYFRPGNNASRAQIAKIVSNAAGFSDNLQVQLFEDVPTTDPFFQYIGRLAIRDIISGYACGGTGEPCNPPGNRPYFRPGSNVTRGQAAKIVAITWYPGCITPAYHKPQ